MRRLLGFVLAAFLMILLPALGQQPASRAQKRRPAAAAKRAPASVEAEAAQAADQLKLLTRFLYLYGRISVGLEQADEQARKNEMSESALAKMKQNRQGVVSNIAGIRAGFERLEAAFHNNPKLQRQYTRVLSASEAAAKAEELAAAGQFNEAGRALEAAAEHLVDALRDTR